SFMLAVRRAGRMLRTEFVVTAGGAIHERLPEDDQPEKILIFGLEGEMFFGSATALERHFDYMEERAAAHARVVVLRMKRVRNPDAVSLTLLRSFVDRMKERDVHVLLCGVRTALLAGMKKTGLAERLGAENIFVEERVRQTSTLLAIRHAY